VFSTRRIAGPVTARSSRLIGAAVVGAALLVGTSGCAMISTQATTIPYSPGDGVNIPDSGPLQVRNVLIVGEEEGGPGNMIAAIVNPTGEDATLTIELGEGSAAQSETVRVPARSTVSLGNPEGDDEPILFDEIEGPPGSTVAVYFQSGDGDGVLQEVPVLSGDLDYYGELLP
jgi:hypothetical protein